MNKKPDLECESCGRMTVTLYASAEHSAYVCASEIDLDALMPTTRADAAVQREWEKERERQAA